MYTIVYFQRLAKETLSTLRQMRTDDEFRAFWQKIIDKQDACDIDEPHLPRRRKVPYCFLPCKLEVASSWQLSVI